MKYRDEKDKCFGIVGMAIALKVWDAEDMYSDITLDAEGFDCINFSYNYYFTGVDSVSPRVALQHQLKIYKLMMGLAISNVMCRSMVGDDSGVSNGDRDELLDVFTEQGSNELSLTNDECRTIFNKSYNYLQRLYNYQQVRQMARDFSNQLTEKRRMSACEVADIISVIGE